MSLLPSLISDIADKAKDFKDNIASKIPLENPISMKNPLTLKNPLGSKNPLKLLNPFSGSTLKKEINLTIYVSDTYTEYLTQTKNADIKEVITSMVKKTEDRLNTFTTIGLNPVKIEFLINISHEVPEGIQLDGCFSDKSDLVNLLNVLNTCEPKESSIVILNCNAGGYEPLFSMREIRTPIVTMDTNILCTKRALIFLETSYAKSLEGLASGLLYVAGARVKNPVMVHKSFGGDEGVRYKLKIEALAIEQIRKGVCYLNKADDDDEPKPEEEKEEEKDHTHEEDEMDEDEDDEVDEDDEEQMN